MLRPPLANPGLELRNLMRQGTVVMPGVYDAITALAARSAGFEAAYISGAALTNSQVGVPDIGMGTMTEFAAQAARICQVVQIPIVSDADTGFGEAWNVARTVIEMERAGLAGIHIEDQVMPKKCGHLDGKELVPCLEMEQKVRAAVESKRHSEFLVIARTDARGVEGLEAAISRAQRYVEAGADAVFPEGLTSEQEFEEFRRRLACPLLANMTEFGKTPMVSVDRFAELGYEMVIFPVSAMRIAMKAVSEFFGELKSKGTQAGSISRMQTRQELYGLVEYSEYERFDSDWRNPGKNQ